MAQEDVFKKLVSHCKEYGFVFPQVRFTMAWVQYTTMVRWVWSPKTTSSSTWLAEHGAAARKHRRY